MMGEKTVGMSRNEASTILGVKPNASTQEIKIAYKKLAKKYHPDVSKDPKAQEKFVRINKAQMILRLGPELDKKKLDYKKEYSELIKEMGHTPTDKKLSDAYDKLVDQAIILADDLTKAEKLEKIKLAYEKADREMAKAEYLRDQQKRAITKMILEQNRSDEELLTLMKEKMELEEGKKQLKSNLHKLHQQIIKKVRIIRKKAHIPTIKSEKGKKILRYTLLTASLVSAIIAGRYYYNKRTRAYEPKLLTYRGK